MAKVSGSASPTRRKYKESCSQCAFVKVKCGKEKPTCARCQNRGLRCNYELSHRAGRRPASSRVLPVDGGVGTPMQLSAVAASAASTTVSAPVDRDEGEGDNPAQIFSSLPTALDEVYGLSAPSPSLFNPPEVEMSHNLDTSSFYFPFSLGLQPLPTSRRENGAGIPDAMLSDLVGSHEPWPAIDGVHNQPDSSLESFAGSRCCDSPPGSGSRCSRAMLTVLARAQNSSPCELQANPFFETAPILAEEAMNVNRRILDVASSVLECPCHHQLRYLLVFAAMDVLARHVTVAASRPAEGEDRLSRASLVFGELHRVLHFIESLSQHSRRHLPPRRSSSSPSSLSSPRHSPAPLPPNFGDLLLSMDPVSVGTGMSISLSTTDLTSKVHEDENHFQLEENSGLSDFTFWSHEAELRRQFERVRDEIKSILRTE
ncbi:hypothetical protein BDW72DRAFT_172460 [Aspergillus terricola var. indicus]